MDLIKEISKIGFILMFIQIICHFDIYFTNKIFFSYTFYIKDSKGA